MAFFRGTATDRLYQTGKSYVMNGDVYKAAEDGSFVNQRTNRSTVGSSREIAEYKEYKERQAEWRKQNPTASVTQGPGAGHVITGEFAVVSGGAGNHGASTAKPSKKSAGSKLEISAMVPKDGPLKRIGVGGQQESLGGISDIGWARTATGWVPVPSSDIKERIEDNLFMELSWFTRNYVTNMITGGGSPPDFLADEYSRYVPYLNEWRSGSVGNRDLFKEGRDGDVGPDWIWGQRPKSGFLTGGGF